MSSLQRNRVVKREIPVANTPTPWEIVERLERAGDVSTLPELPDKRSSGEFNEFGAGAQLRRFEQKTSLQLTYAIGLIFLILSWSIGIFGCVGISGLRFEVTLGIAAFVFAIPEKVVIALLGGATLSVIGLVWVVVKHLFPDGDHDALIAHKWPRATQSSRR